MRQLKERHADKFPTVMSRWKRFLKVFYSKLWATDAQCRVMRSFVILFAMVYAGDELACCRFIPNQDTRFFVVAFLFFLGVYFFGVCGLKNVCSSYHAFLYEEKSGEVIKIFNNSHIRAHNRVKVPIHLFENVCGISPSVLENVVLSVRSSINYDPYLQRGFRFIDVIHLLDELCRRHPGMGLRVRVEVKRHVRPGDHDECFEITHTATTTAEEEEESPGGLFDWVYHFNLFCYILFQSQILPRVVSTNTPRPRPPLRAPFTNLLLLLSTTLCTY
jgi:hypothetical protein